MTAEQPDAAQEEQTLPAHRGAEGAEQATSEIGEAANPASEAFRLLLADTRSGYETDLRDFFAFQTGATVSPACLASFCALPSGPMALALNGYKEHLQGRGLAKSTVNRSKMRPLGLAGQPSSFTVPVYSTTRSSSA